jgi:hypothetical protein
LAVEGITRINELLATTMSNELQMDTQEPLTAKFRLKNDGTMLQGKLLEMPELHDEESFSMASRGTYKFVQEQTMDYVSRFKAHPYSPRLIMTAHQGEGKTNEGVSARCLGPLIYGRAGVANAPGWFSSYFHIEVIPENTYGQGSPEMRALWFRFHLDTNGSGLQWPAKLGASPRLTEAIRAQFPQGFAPVWIKDGKLEGGIARLLHQFDSVQ